MTNTTWIIESYNITLNIVKNHISPQNHYNQTTLQNHSNHIIFNFFYMADITMTRNKTRITHKEHGENKKNWKICQILPLSREL